MTIARAMTRSLPARTSCCNVLSVTAGLKRSPCSNLRSRLAKYLSYAGIILLWFTLASSVLGMPACDHLNCSVDCHNEYSNVCNQHTVAECPVTQGCQVANACLCEGTACSQSSCAAYQSVDECAQSGTCSWKQFCAREDFDCDVIHDEDTCRNRLTCSVAWNC